VASFVGSKDRFSFAIFERDSQYGIAVIIINDHDVVVSGAGRRDEFYGEVHIGLPRGLHHCNIACVGYVGASYVWEEVFFLFQVLFGGSEVFALLIHVAFYHRHGQRWVFLEAFQG